MSPFKHTRIAETLRWSSTELLKKSIWLHLASLFVWVTRLLENMKQPRYLVQGQMNKISKPGICGDVRCASSLTVWTVTPQMKVINASAQNSEKVHKTLFTAPFPSTWFLKIVTWVIYMIRDNIFTPSKMMNNNTFQNIWTERTLNPDSFTRNKLKCDFVVMKWISDINLKTTTTLSIN